MPKVCGKRLLALGLLLGFAGCGQKSGQAPTHFTPPSLWRVTVVEDSGGQTGVIDVCAHSELIASFSRVEPRVNGQTCAPKGKPVKDTADEHVGRCEAGGAEFGLYVNTKGQRDSDFTVRFALLPLDAPDGKVVQARRYQHIGACPAGWKAGDQGPPGGKPTSNLLSGRKLG